MNLTAKMWGRNLEIPPLLPSVPPLPLHWDSGLCPSSEILKTREHNVSETGPVIEVSFI
jgi:hypothetical protein